MPKPSPVSFAWKLEEETGKEYCCFFLLELGGYVAWRKYPSMYMCVLTEWGYWKAVRCKFSFRAGKDGFLCGLVKLSHILLLFTLTCVGEVNEVKYLFLSSAWSFFWRQCCISSEWTTFCQVKRSVGWFCVSVYVCAQLNSRIGSLLSNKTSNVKPFMSPIQLLLSSVGVLPMGKTEPSH